MWKKQFEEVSNVILDKGYKILVYTDAEDQVDFEAKTVHVNSRNHPQTKFYTLLHELGHIIIAESAEDFLENHPMYVHASGCRGRSSAAYRVSLIAEEIEAWKIGRQYARSKKLYIDDDKYDKHMTESVMTYIEWTY